MSSAAAIVAAALSPALELLVPQLPVVQWNDAGTVASSGVTLDVERGARRLPRWPSRSRREAPAIPWTTLLLASSGCRRNR